MKKTLLLSTVLFSTITSSYATNGLYLGLEGGIASQDGLPSAANVGATSLNNSLSPNSIRFGAGYNHDLFKRFGIGFEAAIANYAKATYTYAGGGTTEITSRTVEFLAVGTIHVHPKFDVLAKIGGLRLTPAVSGLNTPPQNTKISTEAAIGGVYNFTPHLAATLTYAHVFGSQLQSLSDLNGKAPSVNEGMLGVRYTFGG